MPIPLFQKSTSLSPYLPISLSPPISLSLSLSLSKITKILCSFGSKNMIKWKMDFSFLSFYLLLYPIRPDI